MAERSGRTGPSSSGGPRGAASGTTPRPRGPAARGPKESPEELAKKVQALENQKKEDLKEKKKEDAERKKQLQAAKKKLNTEIALTKSAVRKEEMGINKLQTQLTRLDTAKDSTSNKKTAQMQKMDQLLHKNQDKHNETEGQLAEKMSKAGLAKGRLSHLEFAQAMLEKGVIIDITQPDPRFQSAPAIEDKEKRGTGPDGRLLALEDHGNMKTDMSVQGLTSELERLQAENEKLKKMVEGSMPTVLTLDEQGYNGSDPSGMGLQNGSPLASACSSRADIDRMQSGLSQGRPSLSQSQAQAQALAQAEAQAQAAAAAAQAAGGPLAGVVAGPGQPGTVLPGPPGAITGGQDGEPLRRVIQGPTRAYSMPPNYDGRSGSPMMFRGSMPGGMGMPRPGMPGFVPGAGMLPPGVMPGAGPGGRFPTLGGGMGRPLVIPLRPGSSGSMANLPSFFGQGNAPSPRPMMVPAAATDYPRPMTAGSAEQGGGSSQAAVGGEGAPKPGWAAAFANGGGSFRGGMAEASGGTPSMTSRAHLVEPRVPSPAMRQGAYPGRPLGMTTLF